MHILHNCGILELAKQVKLMNYQYKFFRFVSSHKTYTDFLCRGYKKTFSEKWNAFALRIPYRFCAGCAV